MPRESPMGGGAVAPGADPSMPEEPAFDRGTATLAHELNNPLAIVVANLDFALKELTRGPGHSPELTRAIREAADAADRLHQVVARALGTVPSGHRDSPVSAVAPSTRSSQVASEGGAGVARVLVVDDEPMVGKALQRCLREYEVVVTTDGRDALELLAQGERFDFVLCDLMMPAMSGMEFLEQLTRVSPLLARRLVFITGGATTPEAHRFLETARNPVVEKPFDLDSLRETLRGRVRIK